MRACACVPWPPCGGQRTVCGSWFSISMWVDFEVKLIRETYTTTKTKTKKKNPKTKNPTKLQDDKILFKQVEEANPIY